MTVFDLVKKNMRKNISRYSLYFFSMIFSIIVYYVFATLQYDQSISKFIGEELRLQGILMLQTTFCLPLLLSLFGTQTHFLSGSVRESSGCII